MRSTNYAQASRAAFFSVLLLSQHAVVDANTWATGRPSRSSTLAVAAPGGRDRPIRDWTAISRDASKAKRSKGKAEEKLDEAVAAAEEALEEAVVEVAETTESADAESLEIEKGTPQALALTLGKVAVIATVGIYGAKKVVEFARRAFLKARKEASEKKETVVVFTKDAKDGEGEEAEGEVSVGAVVPPAQGGDGEEQAGTPAVSEVEDDDDEDDEDGEDEVTTDGYVTADEEEREGQDAPESGETMGEVDEEVSEHLAGLDGGVAGGGESDSRTGYSGGKKGDVDVSYV